MMQIVLIVFLGALTPACGGGLDNCTTKPFHENEGITMGCTWGPNSPHVWELDGRRIAQCNANSASCTRLVTRVSSDAPLQIDTWQPNISKSELSAPRGKERAFAGFVQCKSGSNISVCTIRVAAYTEATCNVSIDRSTWTAQIVCRVKKMYSSTKVYRCDLPDSPELRWHSSNSHASGNLTLSTFTENRTDYLRGTCVIRYLTMPTTGGFYKGGMEFVPPTRGGFVKTPDLFIAPPRGLPTLVNCPVYINEGDDLNCTCQPAPSSPLAATKWSGNSNGPNAHFLTRKNVSKSFLDRAAQGLFKCSQSWGHGRSFRGLRITYRPGVSSRVGLGKNVTHCSQTWDFSQQTWTVTFICYVERMYRTAEQFICNWIYPGQRQPSQVNGELSLVERSINGTVFKEGTCALKAEEPILSDGLHNYSLRFLPGDIPTGPDKYSALALEIRQPGPPLLLNCPELVNANDDVHCICRPSQGIPPAVVTWTKVSRNTSGLLEMKVNRSMDGHSFNCTQFWGGWSQKFAKTVNYTLRLTAVPEDPLLTPKQKVVVGVAVGAPLTWGFVATVIQLCQILGNAGWLPFLPMGGKKEEKEEKDEDDDDSDEEEPPTKCSRFLNCIFCGGAGMCLLSFLFCISCGKVMSKKFIWRKDKDIQDPESNREQPSPPPEEGQLSPPQEETQPPPPPEEQEAKTSDYAETKPSEPMPDNSKEQQSATFTKRYFAKLSWLENPHQDISQAETQATRKGSSLYSRTKLHGYYSSHSDVHIKLSENKRDDDIQTIKSDQKVNDEGKGAAENVVTEKL